MRAAVKAAEAAFTQRWLVRSLERVNPGLHAALVEQQGYFHQAEFAGEEVELHGEALVRGWEAAVRAMEAAEAPEDAYQLGIHGTHTVVIGERPEGASRWREVDGRTAAWLTPDEVAKLWAGVQAINAAQTLWPGAWVTRRDREPGEDG